MSTRKETITGAAWLVAGRAGGQALSLVRNIIVARLIGPEDLGLAATFALTLSFLEAISAISVDRLLVQAPDGHDERFQRTAQAAQAIRGAILGVVIFASSWGLAALFDAPGALWAYQAVALVPLLRGLSHLDAARMQRAMNFTLDVKVELWMQVGLLALAWPLCAWLGDYRAAAWLTILSGVFYLGLTHLVAERPYRWAWDRALAHRIMVFGWPLLVNGLLMFLILQGDQFIIGSSERLLGVVYTHENLGQFVAAAGLALAVHFALASVAGSLFLPLLAHVQPNQQRFCARYELCLQVLAMIGVGVGSAGIFCGPALIGILYGDAYEVAGVLFPWLLAMQMVRLLRVAPTLAAMARADTKATMIANGVRVIGFAGAIILVAQGRSLESIAALGLIAELLAGVSAFIRLMGRSSVPLVTCVVPTTLVLIGIGGSLLATRSDFMISAGTGVHVAFALASALLSVGLSVALLPHLRRESGLLYSHLNRWAGNTSLS